ncbi:MAG: hypothetical protein HY255_01145 [Betaproteobacteria bacterium]|nr:hypothetical protein [Betaproteobacteria bacterium]
MNRNPWRDLGPSLLLAVGILAATLAGVHARLAGPVTLALAVAAADALYYRLRGRAFRPSRAGLLLAGVIAMIGAIVTLLDAGSPPTLIPTLGMAAWVTLPLRRRGVACRCDPTALAKEQTCLPS